MITLDLAKISDNQNIFQLYVLYIFIIFDYSVFALNYSFHVDNQVYVLRVCIDTVNYVVILLIMCDDFVFYDFA